MNDMQAGIAEPDEETGTGPLEPARQELDTISDTLDLHTGHLEQIIAMLGDRNGQGGNALSEILRLLVKRIDQQLILINRLNQKFDALAETVQEQAAATRTHRTTDRKGEG